MLEPLSVTGSVREEGCLRGSSCTRLLALVGEPYSDYSLFFHLLEDKRSISAKYHINASRLTRSAFVLGLVCKISPYSKHAATAKHRLSREGLVQLCPEEDEPLLYQATTPYISRCETSNTIEKQTPGVVL